MTRAWRRQSRLDFCPHTTVNAILSNFSCKSAKRRYIGFYLCRYTRWIAYHGYGFSWRFSLIYWKNALKRLPGMRFPWRDTSEYPYSCGQKPWLYAAIPVSLILPSKTICRKTEVPALKASFWRQEIQRWYSLWVRKRALNGMHYTEHIIFMTNHANENDQLRQSHPLRMLFINTKIKKSRKF